MSLRTVRYWDAGRSRVPWPVVRLLRILRLGDLGALHDDWAGWIINRNGLWSPDGKHYTEASMRRWWLTCEQARLFRDAYDRGVFGGVGATAPALTLQIEAGNAAPSTAAAHLSPPEAVARQTALATCLPGSDFVASQAGGRAVDRRLAGRLDEAAATRSGAGLVILKTSDTLGSPSRFLRHFQGVSRAS